MLRIAVIVVAVGLTGCASEPARPLDPVEAQCAYEAQLATANQRDNLYSTFMQVQLIGACLKAHGR